MSKLFDSFWRALAYCLHPRVMLLSLAPLLLMALLWVALGYFFWDSALGAVRSTLESSAWLQTLWNWFESLGLGALKTVMAPLLLIFAATPFIVMLTLLMVAALMTPALVSLVARRRFPALQRRRGASWWIGLLWSLASVALAALALIISLPLWLVPPLILVLPPLIWGWLTYRVMAFDALADHASQDERREILKRHRGPLLGMGLLVGSLGAAPGLVWASGAMFAVYFVPLLPLAIWVYVLVFSFSSLWFAHYCLDALQALRVQTDAPPGGDSVNLSFTEIPHDPPATASLPAP